MRFKTEEGDLWFEIPGIVMATMRQIAVELLGTLHRDAPNFVRDDPRLGAK
jgi:hypothetical protein